MSDLLLKWMSFRGLGRMDDISAEILGDTPMRRMVDNLAMLGHLEIVNRVSWRIAPPVLAGLPSDRANGPSAILCGARTPGVLTSLDTACRNAGAQMTVTVVPDLPSIIRVTTASKTVLASAAAEAGIPLQRETAFTLLACVPAIRNWPRTPCPMVAGKVQTVRRFSRSKISWVSSTLAEATDAKSGFFRIKRDWDWVSILKTGVNDCAYIEDRAGRFATAYRLRVARWNAHSHTLSLPSQLYPPGMIGRALTLCTGSLPLFDAASHRISFAGISPEILRLTLAITGLRLA